MIKRSDQGENAIAIANSLGVGKTQIQNKIKGKGKILERWHGGESVDRKLSKICIRDRQTSLGVVLQGQPEKNASDWKIHSGKGFASGSGWRI